jgi:hypothetical protein
LGRKVNEGGGANAKREDWGNDGQGKAPKGAKKVKESGQAES